MEKIKKQINLILIIFGIVFVMFLIFLFIYLKPVTVNQDDSKIIKSAPVLISQEKLSSNYQREIKLISNEVSDLTEEYYNKISSSTTNQTELNNLAKVLIDSLSEMKIRAIDLRVPDVMRSTHLSFVMMIDSLKNALDNNDSENYKKEYLSLLELQKEIP